MTDVGSTSLGELIWRGDEKRIKGSPAQNKQAANRLIEDVWNNGDQEALNELVAGNFVDHNNPFSGGQEGVNGYRQALSTLRNVFPDLSATSDQITAEDNRVAIRLTLEGVHKGNFMGIPPTNKNVSFGGMIFLHFQGGKIAEQWGIFDLPALMGQLGGGN